MLDLDPRHLAIVRALLHRQLPGVTVWAFGSRTTGMAKTYSDLDLVIRTDTPVPLRTLASLETDFADSDLPFSVDVVPWSDAAPALRSRIERSHVVID